MITDKEFEDYVKSCPVRTTGKIGGKEEAIRAIKNLGYGEYSIEDMIGAFSQDGGCPIYRMGRTYYWTTD